MSDPQTVDELLIDRYVADECTPAERRLVEQWAASDPAHRQQLDLARFMANASHQPFHQVDPSPSWQSWLEREGLDMPHTVLPQKARAADDAPRFQSYRTTSRTPILRSETSGAKWVWLVACVVTVLAADVLVATRHQTTDQRFTSGRQYTTNVGESRTLMLTDGTRVVLAPASRLRLARDYGEGSRETELEGHAFFTVVHNETQPFSVRTKDMLAQDVGTSFDLKAYADDAEASLAVAEGAVSVTRIGCSSRTQQSVCTTGVRQGDVAFLDGTGVSVSHIGNVDPYLAWMQGRLVFNQVPLRDVVRELERTFDLQIKLADSTMGHRMITGSFDRVPIDQVLEEITRSLGARFEHHGHVIAISPRVASSSQRGSNVPAPLSTALKASAVQ